MEIFDALRTLGFSEYEVKTYLALLDSAPATGYQVSKVSGVPRSMIYEVLNRLKARGLVLESNDETSAQYKPLPPQTLLDQYRTKIDATLSFLGPELEKIYTEDRDNRIWSIQELDYIFSYADGMLSRATAEVNLMLNDDHYNRLEDSLAMLQKTDVTINFLATGNKTPPFGKVTHHPPLESKIQGLEDTLLLLVDNYEVLIANTVRNPNATITTNSNLILIARQFFWMEMFTQRVLSKLGDDFSDVLEPQDREILLNKIKLDRHKENE